MHVAAVERLVNLALLLAASGQPITADRIRHEGIYPTGQDDAAFLRMFERDKDELRGMGFAIETDATGAYRLDARATFAASVDLTPSESAVLKAVGSALLHDPSFPFTEDLRLGLAKISAEVAGDRLETAARLADEEPAHQGEIVARLSAAAATGKRVEFDYTNSLGDTGPHTLEPYGLFLHDGRWYAVGRDHAKDEVRTYAVTRMAAVTVNSLKPRTPDFERPSDFDVALFARLPFQYGPPDAEFIAQISIDPSIAWRAAALSAGRGELESREDGSLLWRVSARSASRLLRFVIENGPGLSVTAPSDLPETLRNALARTAALHG